MRNTRTALAAAAVALASTFPAGAQQQVQGFATERLQLSAPGSTRLVLDDLKSQGLGGAVSLSLGYARRPLFIEAPNAAAGLAVVEHQAFADVGFALSYARFQMYTHLSSPLYVSGKSGTVGGFQFAGASANVEQDPDTISDVPVGIDARILGDSTSPSRLGVGALLVFPSGSRAGYLTDDTFRMIARALFAGDAGSVSYAAHLGLHVRPLDASPRRELRGATNCSSARPWARGWPWPAARC